MGPEQSPASSWDKGIFVSFPWEEHCWLHRFSLDFHLFLMTEVAAEAAAKSYILSWAWSAHWLSLPPLSFTLSKPSGAYSLSWKTFPPVLQCLPNAEIQLQLALDSLPTLGVTYQWENALQHPVWTWSASGMPIRLSSKLRKATIMWCLVQKALFLGLNLEMGRSQLE